MYDRGAEHRLVGSHYEKTYRVIAYDGGTWWKSFHSGEDKEEALKAFDKIIRRKKLIVVELLEKGRVVRAKHGKQITTETEHKMKKTRQSGPLFDGSEI